jgi:retron-type reverse transcriptase
MIRDPKTRLISKSAFIDRMVHHALCNVIEPLWDKTFIYDSFANRKGKGTSLALKRFDAFKRKVSKNNTVSCYALKADIRKYFETMSHDILKQIIRRRIHDKEVLWLTDSIIDNYHAKELRRGMPLGNLTSQFFANVYLNELDHFIKHQLKATYYLRYVDDFIILHSDEKTLECFKHAIQLFLTKKLSISLHPDKTRIRELNRGIDFVGFRIFFYHKLLRVKNIRKCTSRFTGLRNEYDLKHSSLESLEQSFAGWNGYAKQAQTHKLQMKMNGILFAQPKIQ